MAYEIPTTDEIAAQFLSAIEARLNQTTPPVARAFNKVLSVSLGLFGTGIYKYASDRLLQTLALTATGDGLDKIGSEYGVTRLPAVAAVLEFEATGVDSTVIPLGTQWTSESTGEIYTTLAEATIASGTATLEGVASTPGETGNLANGETLTVNAPIAGLDTEATVTDTTTTGSDRETDTAYRRRVLTRIRAAGGGGNAADYRQWAEAVSGVRRAFPYAGKPRKAFQEGITIQFFSATNTVVWSTHDWVEEAGALVGDQVTFSGTVSNNGTFVITAINASGDTLTVTGPLSNEGPSAFNAQLESTPGDRVVYIESTDTGSEGVPTQALLDAVRDALLNDPDTGLDRDVLGTTPERLYVEPIDRLAIKVRINGLTIDAGIEAATKAQILAAVTDHLYNRNVCFVDGLDYPGDRLDSITELTISNVVWGVLRPAGGVADDIQIKMVRDDLTSYQLERGELAKEDGVTYDAWT
jgi:hypothetical protein